MTVKRFWVGVAISAAASAVVLSAAGQQTSARALRRKETGRGECTEGGGGK